MGMHCTFLIPRDRIVLGGKLKGEGVFLGPHGKCAALEGVTLEQCIQFSDVTCSAAAFAAAAAVFPCDVISFDEKEKCSVSVYKAHRAA
jgi:hypothetical protein|tara:strand:- start:1568 stop:1834 length:267 start_codon:yes stop_codon:yes gene_type:complete